MINIEKLYNLFLQFPEIVTDSRKVKPNSLFFALKGTNYNGNLFAKQALETGCEYAICDEKEIIESDKFIYTYDVYVTLRKVLTPLQSIYDQFSLF